MGLVPGIKKVHDEHFARYAAVVHGYVFKPSVKKQGIAFVQRIRLVAYEVVYGSRQYVFVLKSFGNHLVAVVPGLQGKEYDVYGAAFHGFGKEAPVGKTRRTLFMEGFVFVLPCNKEAVFIFI